MKLIEERVVMDSQVYTKKKFTTPLPNTNNIKLTDEDKDSEWDSVICTDGKLWKQASELAISEGETIFAYHPGKLSEKLLQVIVVKNYSKPDDYSVAITTAEYSSVLCHVPSTYLRVELYDMLEGLGINKNILETFKQIIQDETSSN